MRSRKEYCLHVLPNPGAKFLALLKKWCLDDWLLSSLLFLFFSIYFYLFLIFYDEHLFFFCTGKNKATFIWRRERFHTCHLKQHRKSPPQIRSLMITFIIFENKPNLFKSVNTNQDWKQIYNWFRVMRKTLSYVFIKRHFTFVKAWKQDLLFYHHS